jgi:hypothetical protein
MSVSSFLAVGEQEYGVSVSSTGKGEFMNTSEILRRIRPSKQAIHEATRQLDEESMEFILSGTDKNSSEGRRRTRNISPHLGSAAIPAPARRTTQH